MSDEEKNKERVPQSCENRFLGFGVECQDISKLAGPLGEELVHCLVKEAIERRCVGDDLPCPQRESGQACRMHGILSVKRTVL